jgi:SOS-response transcriptional repressor LexA
MDWVDRLKQAVDATGKQSAVAARAGVDASALSDILRRDTADPKVQTLLKLCRECGVTLGWLFGEAGFELGDADFRLLQQLETWAHEKQELRQQPEPGARIRAVKPLPAVATPRGEIWAVDEVSDRTIPLEYQNAGANAVFITRGDSMIDAGILEGDFLFVRKSRNWRTANHQIIVARLQGTPTVKRLHIEGGVVTLRSESRWNKTITINEAEESFELIGIVLGVARDLLRR